MRKAGKPTGNGSFGAKAEARSSRRDSRAGRSCLATTLGRRNRNHDQQPNGIGADAALSTDRTLSRLKMNCRTIHGVRGKGGSAPAPRKLARMNSAK
jgi:hypothetical protein